MVIVAGALAAVSLLGAAVLSGLVFAPSRHTRTAVEEMRELTELRFRISDVETLAGAALVHVAAAREANLRSCRRHLRAVALYVLALGSLGAQVLLIAAVHLPGG